MKPKVVVITMFEPGGGKPGELALLREREGLRELDIPAWGLDGLYGVPERGLFALLAGVGTANTAVSLMTLGLATEWDFRETLWIISGIGGGNPNRCSLGSPVWADWVVDGDLAHEVDPRDIPADWPIGIFPLGAREPYGSTTLEAGLFGRPYQVFQLHQPLVDWAYNLSAGLEMEMTPDLNAMTESYAAYAGASLEPSVSRGDSLSAARFWHGPRHNAWAEQWVRYWTKEQGTFYTSAMEDTGTLLALEQLDRMGRVDKSRVLLLRTVSNYTMPPGNGSIIDNLTGEDSTHYPGLEPALENSYRVVKRILEEVL